MNLAWGRPLVCAAALALAITVSGRGSEARTVAVTAQLDYSAGAGCPTARDFEAIVATRLGYDAFRADAPEQVSVDISRAGRALEGRLEWRHAAGGSIGQQIFPSRSGDCAELARAMGFALAVQFQLMASTVEDAEPAAPLQEPPSPPVVAPPPPVPLPLAQVRKEMAGVPAKPASSRGAWVMLGGGAAAGLGITPGPIAVGRLFATLGWTHLAFEVAGEATAPAITRRADGAGFSHEQFLAGLAACGVRGPWSLCAVAKAGQLRVSGEAVDVPRDATGLVVQTGLRLAAWHALGHRAYIIGRAEGLARLSQGRVTLDSMTVWTSPPIAALIGIDIALRFQ